VVARKFFHFVMVALFVSAHFLCSKNDECFVCHSRVSFGLGGEFAGSGQRVVDHHDSDKKKEDSKRNVLVYSRMVWV